MPKLKVLSGQDVIKIIKFFGFSVHAQKGSHIRLRKNLYEEEQNVTVPNHKELGSGTLKSIYGQLTKYIPENELREHFYTK